MAIDQLNSIVNVVIATRDQSCPVVQREGLQSKFSDGFGEGSRIRAEAARIGAEGYGLTIAEHGVTSLHALGIPASMAAVDQALRTAWGQVFG